MKNNYEKMAAFSNAEELNFNDYISCDMVNNSPVEDEFDFSLIDELLNLNKPKVR